MFLMFWYKFIRCYSQHEDPLIAPFCVNTRVFILYIHIQSFTNVVDANISQEIKLMFLCKFLDFFYVMMEHMAWNVLKQGWGKRENDFLELFSQAHRSYYF